MCQALLTVFMIALSTDNCGFEFSKHTCIYIHLVCMYVHADILTKTNVSWMESIKPRLHSTHAYMHTHKHTHARARALISRSLPTANLIINAASS